MVYDYFTLIEKKDKKDLKWSKTKNWKIWITDNFLFSQLMAVKIYTVVELIKINSEN